MLDDLILAQSAADKKESEEEVAEDIECSGRVVVGIQSYIGRLSHTKRGYILRTVT